MTTEVGMKRVFKRQIVTAAIIGFALLIPHAAWAAKDRVPFPDCLGSSKKLHFNATIDILLLLFFLLHAFYGLRVILIDVGWMREDKFFWRTLGLSLGIFGAVVWYVYVHGY